MQSALSGPMDWILRNIKNIPLPFSRIIRSMGLKPGLYFERKSLPYTQTIVRTWGAYSRPPMSIYTVGIAQVPSINTPTIRRPGDVDAGLSLANNRQPLRIRRL